MAYPRCFIKIHNDDYAARIPIKEAIFVEIAFPCKSVDAINK